ncbi:MAG TPA: cytosine permease, partial [Blastocatellia bacterium]
YWVLRRRRLDLAELFRPAGRYSYSNGFNWRAIAAMLAAIAPVVPGFLRAATTPNFTGQLSDPALTDTLYTYAWFVTFAVGFCVYYLLMNRHPNLKEE